MADIATQNPHRPLARWPAARIALWSMVGVAAVLALLFAVFVAPLLLAPNRYEGTPSIERLASYRNAALMQQAWSLPVASAYRAGGYEFQANPSFCGPASVANVMRSLGMAADQHRVIDGTRFEPWFGVLLGGLTLDQLRELAAHRLGAEVSVVRGTSLAEFRAILRQANDPGVRIIANFHRGPLFGRGHGHHSPILGYLAAKDLVLVGDVNRDYRPFLVRSEALWKAAATIDEATGQRRGLLIARLDNPRSLASPIAPPRAP